MLGNQQPLRLKKRHSGKPYSGTGAAEGARIAAEQSLRGAVFASAIVIIVFSVLWVLLTQLTGRVFPWMTIVLGILLGFAVRRAGRGIDWRFPCIAAGAALAGALAANVILAAAITAEDLGIGTLRVLSAVTSMTWPVFFREVLTAADIVYAFAAAAVAAFYANRRLTRAEYRAVRLWREGS